MFARSRKCYCMNNEYENNSYDSQEDMDIMEKNCQNINNNDYDDYCECGFEEEKSVFPEEPMLGQSYVPIQYMDKTFKPQIGLKMGTIFPELVSPYQPCQGMKEIEYIAKTNKIKEGCNKCQ